MDINDIQLPAATIAALYPNSLIETGEATKSTPKKSGTAAWKFLGENARNILIVVNYPGISFMPDDALNFLTNMLSACKLSLADTAIINLPNQPSTDSKTITSHFKTRVVLLFDVEPETFGLPMTFPHYQIQPFANSTFLYAPELTSLSNDKAEKTKLWASLKRLFNI